MKYLGRIIFATLALLAFVYCDNSKDDIYTEAIANGLTITALADGGSRTAFDGDEMVTSWSEGDALKIHISGDEHSEINDFEIIDVERGTFSNGDVQLNSEQTYNFFATYNALSVNANSAVVAIGDDEQLQNGNTTAHIAALDPLYGYCSSKPDAVSINMYHTAVVLKLNITNATGKNIEISSVRVKASTGVAIAGKYNLLYDVAEQAGELTLNSEGVDAITLSLNGFSANIGESATAWIATAPFAIAQGGSLLFTVVDSEGNEYDIIKSFDQGKNFQAGKVFATNLEISAVTPASQSVVFDFTDSSTFPSGTPTSGTNVTNNKLICSSGQYKTEIYATNGCYNGGKLSFNTMKKKSDNSEYATITLPQILGYYVSGIYFLNSKSSNSMKAELYKTDNPDTMLEDAKISISTSEFDSADLSTAGVNDDSPMFIKLLSESATGFIYGLKKLEITYTRIGSGE